MTSTLSQPLDRTSRGAGRLLLAAVLLTALDLRTAVTSIGPVLSELRAGTGASAQLLGQLTALPLVCFAVVGSAAPATARRLGSYRTLAAAMALMAAGLLLRAVSDAPGTLLACTALALVGGAVGNVLLPVLVKEHFADRVGSLTAAYSTALAVGATLAAGTTVPLAEWAGRGSAAGGWRTAIGVWALPAAVTALLWLAVAARRPAPAPAGGRPAVRGPARSTTGWALAGYFGAQSLMAFVTVGWAAQFAWDSGVPAATAGWLLALSLALAVPVSLVVPRLATRLASPRPVVVALALCYLAGYLVMLTAPVAGACVWAVLLGVGGGTYPLALTLIGLRSDTPAQTASLSAFVQGAGYLLAATGPLLVGRLYAGTGWTGPFVVLFAALALQLGCGWHAARPVPRPGLSAAAPEPVAHV